MVQQLGLSAQKQTMKNLAGDKGCDDVIRGELTRAKIPIIQVELDERHHEVPFTLEGRLGDFVFQRDWSYYRVHGLVPMKLAQELYEDPCGRDDVRVEGHCGCPAPEEPWISYYDADGYHLQDFKSKQQFEEAKRFIKNYDEVIKDYRFVECPSAVGHAFITHYHIDSVLGLRIFADGLRRYCLDKPDSMFKVRGQVL